ncbi:MAG: putative binding protein precursor [Verrucomicrobiaceae bacterium]|nr:putative binding protein precursor [Verrucomicrobiaceae bacterium]
MSGRTTAAVLAAIVIAIFVVWAATYLWKNGNSASGPPAATLIVYCAASLKAPVEALAKEYENKYHTTVQLQFGASQSLLVGIEISRTGDLYLPADDSYFTAASAKKLVSATVPIASQNGTLMVAAGNPKGIKIFADLLRPEVRLALANPDAAAIGKLVRGAVSKDMWDTVAKKAVVITATVTEAANAVKAGAADAAFIFDSMHQQYPAFDLVNLPEISGVHAQVGVGMLTCSHQGDEAIKFARFLSGKDTGLPVFRANGFGVAADPH